MTKIAANILGGFPQKKPAGRPSQYPWDEWADGQIRELVKGVHFDCDPKSLRSLIHLTARKRNMRATTSVRKIQDENGATITSMIVAFQEKKDG